MMNLLISQINPHHLVAAEPAFPNVPVTEIASFIVPAGMFVAVTFGIALSDCFTDFTNFLLYLIMFRNCNCLPKLN